MQIVLNGKKENFERPLTVEELLRQKNIPKEKVAVEKNLEIIPRAEFGVCQIQEGDTLEIVSFIGGGAPRQKAGGSPAVKTSGAKALVIVESPAKCKTINKYLGSDYEVTASMGHVIDLPKSKMGIDIENNFAPHYIVSKDKKKVLSELKKKAKNKKEIYLACDPDREGEAISWHLKNELGAGKKVVRVVFNEITKEAVKEAFKHPAEVNMHRVGAQQARRVLDRLVGYNLSPLLWQKVGRGLSAGRVQSVALRLVVDREREIKAFKPQEYWSVEADLQKQSGETFKAKLEKIKDKKVEINNKVLAHEITEAAQKLPFKVIELKHQKKKKNPYPPLTTSKLQQSAYNVLRFPAAKTMRVAQDLYEGVEIGDEGQVGLITYMRTDSVRLSDTAIADIRQYIGKEFGSEYLPEKPNVYKSKKDAQGAHEAIRPSSIFRKPADMEQYLTPDQAKLYKLIWETAIESQMVPAQVAQDTVDIACGDYIFHASGSRVEFPGYLAVRGRSEEEESTLPSLTEGEVLKLLKLVPEQHFTKPPARFTDASLVKTLEENGIGRPSTYAPTILTITSRDYVRREGGSLVPTELGMLVTDLLVKHFSKLMDYEFTAGMEDELDKVEDGDMEWEVAVKSFYSVFSTQMDAAKVEMQSVKREAEPTDEICDKCGKPMVIKWGRRGKFMSCSAWPECKNAKSISTSVPCPTCGQGKLVQRRSKMGRGRMFFGCTRYPECTFITNRLPKPEDKAAPSVAPDDKEEKDDIVEDI